MFQENVEVSSKAYFDYLSGKKYPKLLVRLVFFLLELSFRPNARELRGKVLDIGCGLGHFFKVYPEAYGIDLNPYCVQYCTERGYKCVQGDVYHIPFPSEFFDGVLLCHVLEHLDDPDGALTEVGRVLKPGGILSIRVPTASGFRVDSTHKVFFDYAKLTSLLSRYGLKIVRARYYPVPWRALGELIVYNELRAVAAKQDHGLSELTNPTDDDQRGCIHG